MLSIDTQQTNQASPGAGSPEDAKNFGNKIIASPKVISKFSPFSKIIKQKKACGDFASVLKNIVREMFNC
jgi:hypothetical protein